MIKELALDALLATSWSFGAKQRAWFKRRDPECLLKGKDRIVCSRPNKDEIDHLTPQGICHERIKLTEEQTDTPLNAGRLCQNHHRGHPDSKHPDAQQAQWDYKKNPKSFEELRPKRNAKMQQGEKYWNDTHGDFLAVEIRKRTIEYALKHPDDPFPLKVNGKKH